MAGDEAKPPYPSVVAAMRDGWRVIQMAQLREPPRGDDHATGFLPYEFVLEKMVEA
jgi:hypothetical protein